MPCGPPANPSAWYYLISAAIMVLVNTLSWISIISPSRVGISHYAMVAVSPPPNVEGPSVWLGPFSSCGRPNASFETHCTYVGQLDLGFKYSLSVLPERVHFALRAPPFLLGVSLVLTAAFLTVFLVLVSIMTGVLWFHAPHERLSNYKQALAWIAFILFFIGSVNISILEFHFQTSRHVFNVISGGTGLVASRGDSINLAYAAYTLVIVPLCLITKDLANIDDAHHINAMVAHLLLLNAQTTGDHQHQSASLHSGYQTCPPDLLDPVHVPVDHPQYLPSPTTRRHITQQLSSTTHVVTENPDLPIVFLHGTPPEYSTTTERHSSSNGSPRRQSVSSATTASLDGQRAVSVARQLSSSTRRSGSQSQHISWKSVTDGTYDSNADDTLSLVTVEGDRKL